MTERKKGGSLKSESASKPIAAILYANFVEVCASILFIPAENKIFFTKNNIFPQVYSFSVLIITNTPTNSARNNVLLMICFS